MMRRLWAWINERWPASPVIQAVFTEDIPGGGSAFYSLGSSVLFVFIVQAVTGIAQLFYYVPTTASAYTSLSYLRLEVPLGWLIHNLHYWGATAMLVLILLHMTQVFLWGAYKNPRQLTWLLGVLQFLTVMAMIFTGPALQWDERGYWEAEVGTSIAGTVPLVGAFTERLLRGGETLGQLMISRFFVVHAALLAGLLGTFVLLHLVSFRRSGAAGPWSEAKRTRTGPFWPDQMAMDLGVALAVFGILLALAVFVPPPFTGQADRIDPFYTPKPEWSFLFLYQALKYFPGALEVVGTVGIPLVLVLLMLAVPFIDRRKERNPAKRPVALTVYFAVFAAAILLSIAGTRSSPGAQKAGTSAPARTAAPAATSGGEEAAGAALLSKLGCSACHAVNGVGGSVGPDLAHEKERNRTADWIQKQITNPKSHNPNTVMPAFKVGAKDLKTLVDYLLGLKPEKKSAATEAAAAEVPASPAPAPAPASSANKETLAPRLIGDAGHGGLLFGHYCQTCHGIEGKGGVPNPGSDDGTVPPLQPIDRELYDPDPAVFVGKIDTFPQHGSTPEGPHPALKMPAFGDTDTLTQEQIANLEAYVLSLNGVDRAKIVHPGIAPPLFFILTVGTFLAAGAGFWLFRLARRRRPRAERTSP
jgi:ubiquinol-cytochrome c reductase cytochrome b subunit